MGEIEEVLLRHKMRSHVEVKNDDKRISKIFTKVLLSIIFVLISTIYIKLSPDNLNLFKSKVFESNLTFTKINNWYHSVFGNILPSVKEPTTSLVSSSLNEERVDYLDGYKISSFKNTPVKVIGSGLLVFLGEKEGYGNVAIIQGVDGVDIWYGNIVDTDFKLYDYIESSSIIGNTKDDFYYLLFMKDGNFIEYEEYIQEI